MIHRSTTPSGTSTSSTRPSSHQCDDEPSAPSVPLLLGPPGASTRLWLSVAPWSAAAPVAALVALTESDWKLAGESDGGGANGPQPILLNQTSTHEWASRSRTRYSFATWSKLPGVKPPATRAGMPSIRSISAIAPENCWQ